MEKIFLQSMLSHIVLAKDLQQLYNIVASMAEVEGMDVLSYNELKAELGVDDEKNLS